MNKMAAVTIYLEQKVLKEDLLTTRSLSVALARLVGEGSVDIVVLSANGEETEAMVQAFPHSMLNGTFHDLKNMPDISKDKVYISDDSEDLLEWSRLKGKSMLSFRHPMKEKDFLVYRFSLFDNSEGLFNKIKNFIHV